MLVVAGPGETQDLVMSAAAAHEIDVDVETDLDRLAERWREAAAVFVADAHAARVAGRALAHRERVFLVGSDARTLSAWSAPLGARVIPLPEGAAWLGAVLSDGTAGVKAPVVTVMGGSGGVGASTLAAALACRATASASTAASALMDLDPVGGGIDLLLGAEQAQGWRWPRLASAEGSVGDLRPYLPTVDGVTLVSMARGPALDLSTKPLAAITASLRRTHHLVVADVGRSQAAAGREAQRLATRRLLVVAAGVRGVAAAREVIRGDQGDGFDAVLRRGPRHRLPRDVVSEALECLVVGELPDDPRLADGAERGVPPLVAAGRPYRRACERLLRRLTLGDADA